MNLGRESGSHDAPSVLSQLHQPGKPRRNCHHTKRPTLEAWPICRVLSDSGTKIAPATALHHTTGHYPPGRSRDHPRSRGVYQAIVWGPEPVPGSSPLARGLREDHG